MFFRSKHGARARHRFSSSPQFRKGRFHNVHVNPANKSRWNLLRFLLFKGFGSWPTWIANSSYKKPTLPKNNVGITFINHASFLAEWADQRILFDPVFSKRAGPNNYLGPKRRRAPGISLDDLPPIDIVLISHNHYDHLDLDSLKRISKKFNPLIVVPLGDKAWLEKRGIRNIEEMDWWNNLETPAGVKITFVPAQHFSGRSPFDEDKSFWGGFVVQHQNTTLYHAGDTGYGPHFKEIGDRFAIDVALLPIGDYEPSWFLRHVHMGPLEAIQAHKDLGPKRSIPMHSDTFPLSSLNYGEAEKTLEEALKQDPNAAKTFKILNVGETLLWPKDKE